VLIIAVYLNPVKIRFSKRIKARLALKISSVIIPEEMELILKEAHKCLKR